jgi:hypothetical protein
MNTVFKSWTMKCVQTLFLAFWSIGWHKSVITSTLLYTTLKTVQTGNHHGGNTVHVSCRHSGPLCLIKHLMIKMCVGVKVYFHSVITLALDIGEWLGSYTNCFIPREEPLVPTLKVGWPAEPSWMLWKWEKSLVPAKNRTPVSCLSSP